MLALIKTPYLLIKYTARAFLRRGPKPLSPELETAYADVRRSAIELILIVIGGGIILAVGRILIERLFG